MPEVMKYSPQSGLKFTNGMYILLLVYSSTIKQTENKTLGFKCLKHVIDNVVCGADCFHFITVI